MSAPAQRATRQSFESGRAGAPGWPDDSAWRSRAATQVATKKVWLRALKSEPESQSESQSNLKPERDKREKRAHGRRRLREPRDAGDEAGGRGAKTRRRGDAKGQRPDQAQLLSSQAESQADTTACHSPGKVQLMSSSDGESNAA
ncbi:hypothetical protein ED733_007627 [Metarhizium rileyi]|uniref:Uncharacterized protein n=1 Tax=Metarhizium rileyi (strain RCEF 4871) TaxID=1649241 RepID=A0A5C6GFL8_METRR|nr:hypothetical protein ED733_007627 [Metarhizium rileyi]